MTLQTKIERLAKNDAYEMKVVTEALIPDIQWKVERISGYHEAYNKAFDKLDVAAEQRFLEATRKRLIKKGFTGEKTSKLGRNVKIVVAVGGTLLLLNELGYLEPVKVKYRRFQVAYNEALDPESDVYKENLKKASDLGTKLGEKIADVILPEDRVGRYQNRHTVQGETVPDTPEQEAALRQHVQETAAKEFTWEVEENPLEVSDSVDNPDDQQH